MKKTIIITLSSIMIVALIALTLTINKNDSDYQRLSYDSSPFDVSTKTDSSYLQFLEESEQVFPDLTVPVEIKSYKYENGMFENDIPELNIFTDDNKVSKDGIYIPETGDITFEVNVEEAGLYNLNIEYFNKEGRGASINRGLKINGVYQFLESENINLHRLWKDEKDVSIDRVKGKNDIRPAQIESHVWQSVDIYDHMGYYNNPFYFYFEEGLNTITLESTRESFVIGSMTLHQAKKVVSYDQYLTTLENKGVRKNNSDFNYTTQGESAVFKTSPTLNPTAEYSTYKFTPYEKQITRYNAIGGVNWRIPGDEIGWEIDVEEEGLYLLSLTVMQNFSRGQKVSRKLKVNGEVPFEEAYNIEFKYDSDLQYVTVNNGQDLYLHLNKGKNYISLQSTVGIYGTSVQQVNIDIKELRALYREIVMRTGLNPDPIQDYMLHKHIPNLDERMTELKESFEKNRQNIIDLSNSKTNLVSSFDRIIYQLEKFLLDEKNIQKGLRELEQNISNLGSWVIDVSEQPLTIDSLTVHGTEYKAKRVTTNFFERIWHETTLFIESFKNKGDFGSTEQVDGPTIEVWIGTGRDQATILRQLIDESFVKQNNINVNLKLVNMTVLLSATLSGNGPDVAIGVDQKLPVNWGIRNAIKDLTQFDDFNEVQDRFSLSAMTPLSYDKKVYALPDTEDFLVMFYRNDILSEIGINKVPTTWDEIIDISPALQKQYFDFYIPLQQGVLSPVLYSMIEQNKGSLYLNNGAESGLLEPESMDAFMNFSRFFTDYGFVLEANFINRFRSGEMPIGISNFTTYNSLAVFAPEIHGQWNYASYPGTIDKDGNLNRQTTSSVTGSIILEQTKEAEASWEFLKWWTSEKTQLDYARGMEGILGAAARYPTANLGAFSKLPWPAKELILLEDQRANAVGIPTVPGDYIVGRYVDNAFRKVLNDNIIAQDSLYQYHLKINDELTRKRKELGLQ